MKRIAFFIAITLSFSSCELAELNEPPSDDADMDMVNLPTTIPASIEEFEQAFHGGSERMWETASFQLAGFDGLQSCRLDDTMIINSNGMYQYDGGDILCMAEDDTRLKSGTWEVVNGGRGLLFDRDTENEYVADVNGFEDGVIALEGQYLGLSITGVYRIGQ